jgi:hypothetical protein
MTNRQLVILSQPAGRQSALLSPDPGDSACQMSMRTTM